MRRVFEEFGLPLGIRSDNGSPFASSAPCGLTEVSAWWHRLGIRHERIEPGKPQQNGRHERMHLTLKRRSVFVSTALSNAVLGLTWRGPQWDAFFRPLKVGELRGRRGSPCTLTGGPSEGTDTSLTPQTTDRFHRPTRW
jgi:transposase InsO family protein